MSVYSAPKERPRQQYIATSTFSGNFFTYATALNTTTLVTTGTLSNVTTTASNCPAGRILRENGRRLFSNADPGVSTFMVGVVDSITGLSGFIDPNASLFQNYTGARSAELADGLDYSVSAAGSNHRGGSTYTWGNVVAGGQLYSSGGFTSTITSGSNVDINFNNGQLFTINTASGATAASISCSNIPPAGSVGIINLGAAAANSVTFTGTNFRCSFNTLAYATGATAAAWMGATSNVLSNITGSSTILTFISNGSNMILTNAHYFAA